MVDLLSALFRKRCNGFLNGRQPELQRVTLRAYGGVLPYPQRLTFDLRPVLKQRVLHLDDGQDKGIATDAAAERITVARSGHLGPELNGRANSTYDEDSCEERNLINSVFVAQSILCGVCACAAADLNACQCKLLGSLTRRTARRKACPAHFQGGAALDIQRQQPPLTWALGASASTHRKPDPDDPFSCIQCAAAGLVVRSIWLIVPRAINFHRQKAPLRGATAPDGGRVPSSLYGEIHAVKRLWSYLACHGFGLAGRKSESAPPSFDEQWARPAFQKHSQAAQ